MSKAREVWVVGATGLVGREAVLALLEAGGFERVLTLVRRPSGLSRRPPTSRSANSPKNSTVTAWIGA